MSIITVSYNSAKTIYDTIKSVQEQSYPNIEHVFIDGNSSDGTPEIILERKREVDIFISEPDKGIYDAMNKGLKIISGNIVGILNSDDFYATNKIIEQIVKVFETTNCDSLFGDLDFVASDNIQKVVRQWKGSPFKPGSFSKGWHPSHPTFFVHREVYMKYGLFDVSLNVSADFELMLRFLERYRISSQYLNKTIVKMRYGGQSTGSIRKIIEGNKNVMKAFKKNNLPVSPLYPIIRLIPKLKQFIIK